MSHFVFNRPVGGWGKSTEKSKGCRYVQFIYHVHQFPRVISGGSIFPSFPCSLGWNRTLLGGLPSPGEMSSWESTVNPCPFVRKTEIKRKAVATVVPAGMAPACQAARAFQQLGKNQAAAPSPAHQLHLCKKSASSTMLSTVKCRWSVQCIWTGEKPQHMLFPCIQCMLFPCIILSLPWAEDTCLLLCKG